MRKEITLLSGSLVFYALTCNHSSQSAKISPTEFGTPPQSAIQSQKPNETSAVDEGAIGDVKYSILPPKEFLIANGDGWVLMAGQPLMNTSPDALILSKKDLFFRGSDQKGDSTFTLPDARGLFLRGMNEARKDGKGNPDPNTPMGVYCGDVIKKHKHRFKDAWWSEAFGEHQNPEEDKETGLRGGGPDSDNDNKRDYFEHYTLTGGKDESGVDLSNTETRPRNISLYIYVKVRKATSKT